MNINSPYHEGELLVQKLARETTSALRNGVVITDKIPPGAIAFVGKQLTVAVSSLDTEGKVWASLLIGNPGFISAPDAQSLLIDTKKIFSPSDDPFWENITTNQQVGVLAIDLSTRRRLRVNGSIQKIDDFCYLLTVEQAYPNCPKYIQRRHPKIIESTVKQALPAPKHGFTLTVEQTKLIAGADSLFVSTANPVVDPEKSGDGDRLQGCDASHRGGNPGFVEVIDAQRLRIPDYKGNSMFNTLGNIQIYPQAGLVFVDFERGRLLQLSGTAKVLWNQNDPTNQTGGTKRFWELSIAQWRESHLPTELSWKFFDYFPHN